MPIADLELQELKKAYQVLGVPVTSSAPLIKQAYHRLAKRWHPDLYRNDTVADAEATYMMKLVNGAYARIAHAPLRYHIESYPEAREKRTQRTRARRAPVEVTTEGDRDSLPVTHRLEFWIRFMFGAIFGLVISFRLLLVPEFFDRPRVLIVVTTGLVILCGLAATRWGEKLWQKVLAWWWLWS